MLHSAHTRIFSGEEKQVIFASSLVPCEWYELLSLPVLGSRPSLRHLVLPAGTRPPRCFQPLRPTPLILSGRSGTCLLAASVIWSPGNTTFLVTMCFMGSRPSCRPAAHVSPIVRWLFAPFSCDAAAPLQVGARGEYAVAHDYVGRARAQDRRGYDTS